MSFPPKRSIGPNSWNTSGAWNPRGASWVREDGDWKKPSAKWPLLDIEWVPYTTPHDIVDGTLQIRTAGGTFPKLVGAHNALNLAGAMALAERWGVSAEDFMGAVTDFTGAAGRLERRLDIQKGSGTCTVFRDFAHAPSKVEATTRSVRLNSLTERSLPSWSCTHSPA